MAAMVAILKMYFSLLLLNRKLTWNLVGNIGVTCRSKIATAMVAILKMYFWLLLLNQKANWRNLVGSIGVNCLFIPYMGRIIMMSIVRWEGWSVGAKVSCILCHQGVQLILAYSWARPAIIIVGKGRGGMFLFLLFLPFHSCSSFLFLFHLFYYLFYLFSPFLWETTQKYPQGLTCR